MNDYAKKGRGTAVSLMAIAHHPCCAVGSRRSDGCTLLVGPDLPTRSEPGGQHARQRTRSASWPPR